MGQEEAGPLQVEAISTNVARQQGLCCETYLFPFSLRLVHMEGKVSKRNTSLKPDAMTTF